MKGEEFTRLDKADILDFKHGMDWIVWYKFTVGQRFTIAVKDKRSKEVKFSFDNYFGLNKSKNQLYLNIVDDIWNFYYNDVVNMYLDKFYTNGELEIRGTTLGDKGIQLKGRTSFISWDQVRIKEYSRYFAVYNSTFPDEHSTVSHNEYGSETLWSVLKTILKKKT